MPIQLAASGGRPSVPAPSPGRDPRPSRAAGASVLELLGALVLGLLVLSGAYAFLISTSDAQRLQVERSGSLEAARLGIDLLGAAVRGAGLSPLGAAVVALPAGDGLGLETAADADGDGRIGGGSAEEHVAFRFAGPDGSGRHRLLRAVDADGDGLFAGGDDREEVIAEGLVPVDLDGDGALDPLLAYDAPPPAARQVRVAFAVVVRRGRFAGKREERVVLRDRFLVRAEPGGGGPGCPGQGAS